MQLYEWEIILEFTFPTGEKSPDGLRIADRQVSRCRLELPTVDFAHVYGISEQLKESVQALVRRDVDIRITGVLLAGIVVR